MSILDFRILKAGFLFCEAVLGKRACFGCFMSFPSILLPGTCLLADLWGDRVYVVDGDIFINVLTYA